MTERRSILVVDDEKNIRLTVAAALESLDVDVETAVDGEDALARLDRHHFDIVLLDLRMPGMDGMEVLARARSEHPDTQLAILTAHGTVEEAVKAMKFGAADFLQKPFSPLEIRELVADLFVRREIEGRVEELDFETHLAEARREILDRMSSRAAPHVQRALSLRPDNAEAFNLAGIVNELQGRRENARKYYLTALTLDPTYRPADQNLRRLVEGWDAPMDLGIPESRGPGG